MTRDELLSSQGAVPADRDALLASQGAVPAVSPATQAEPDISMLGALGRSMAHGATAGWSPQILGAIEALSDEAFKNPTQSFGDLYRQHRDEGRANYEAGEKQHPYASLIGNLVGAAAPAALTLGGSLGAEGAALGAGAAAEGAEGAAALANAAKAAPGALERALHAGKIGAAYGAVQGAGDSKGDLTKGEIGQTLADSAVGGVAGGVLGAVANPALELGGKALGAVVNKVKPIGTQLLNNVPGGWIGQNFEQGTRGNFTFGKDWGRAGFEGRAAAWENQFDPTVRSAIKRAGDAMGAAMDSADPAAMEKWRSWAYQQLTDAAKASKSPDTKTSVAKAKELIDLWFDGEENPVLGKLKGRLDKLKGNWEADQANAPSDGAQPYNVHTFDVATPDGSLVPAKMIRNDMTGKMVGAAQYQHITTPPLGPEIIPTEGPTVLGKGFTMGEKPAGFSNTTDSMAGAGGTSTNYPGAPTPMSGHDFPGPVGGDPLPNGPDIVRGPDLGGMERKAALKNAAEGYLNQGMPSKRYTIESVGPNGDYYQIVDRAAKIPQRVGDAFPAQDLDGINLAGADSIANTRLGGKLNPDGTMDMRSIHGLKKDLQRLTEVGQNTVPDENISRLVTSLIGNTEGDVQGLNPILRQAPDFAEANDLVHSLKTGQDEGLGFSQILNLDKNGSGPGVARKQLGALDKALPEVITKADGTQVSKHEMIESAHDIAQQAELYQKNSAEGFGHSITGTMRSLTGIAANTAGLAANRLANMSPDILKSVARAIVTQHGAEGKGLANALTELSTRDQQGRNALMFAIQQNPAYRQMLHGITGGNNYEQKK
jgi:hypothetical protein